MQRIIITGGAGFIGVNLLNHLIPKYSDYLFINIDCLTYASNPASLESIKKAPNYKFEKIDIRHRGILHDCFERYNPTGLIHLAAETHVDQSITNPDVFIETNIAGTFNLLEVARLQKNKNGGFRFHQVSTDEVYGTLGDDGYFTELSPYRPNSPYAASKASADHLVRAWHETYGLDCVTSNCCNNYGPYQYPEKLIPLVVRNALVKESIPVYGDGQNVRDWVHVEDHCRAIDLIYHNGRSGFSYNIGGRNEIEAVELVRKICRIIDKLKGGNHEQLIEHVKDRPGHDFRYAIDPSNIESTLGWKQNHNFNDGLEQTVKWYIENFDWLESCAGKQYREYYKNQYVER